ncbi:MAG: aromatic-ring-hydroxylating dioxygenase subunit beta [Burkholderiaceae bacterium]|nr:aromatic-ring-hydroxylating dioxygenase subunit beta [Burkholderiaceae bacterium]
MNADNTLPDPQELALIERFLYTEAQCADESRYDDWEALVEPDMIYWVPRGEGDFDPSRDVSIINDNRPRLATRIRQLKTGTRHSQSPVSPMRRLISNIVATRTGEGLYQVESNFALFEMRVQSTGSMTIWAGRVVHKLRRTDAGLKMYFKKVMLINGDEPVPTLAFLI